MQTRGGLILLGTMGLFVLSSAANAGSIWFEPTAYLSRADMPSDIAKMNPIIEDFEDGSTDAMLKIYPGKILGPGHDSGIKDVTDSVDDAFEYLTSSLEANEALQAARPKKPEPVLENIGSLGEDRADKEE